MDKKYSVHATSFIDDNVSIGDGTKIWHFCHVSSDSKIGEKCNIGQNVFIDKGVTIGKGVKIQNNVSIYRGVTLKDYVFCGPSCVFTNVHNPRSAFPRSENEFKTTTVETGASIGANATIVCGHNVGKNVFVGAGSVVTKDVPDYALVYGNPARIMGWMCECGEKLPFKGDGAAKCAKCKSEYSKSGNTVKKVSDH